MHATAGTRWLRPLVVAVLLLAAAACSDDPPPAGAVKTPTPSVQSSTPTPTETPVEQQVEAAVRAYYAELTRAIQTGNTSRLKIMLLNNCPCYGSVRSIDRLAVKNQRAPGARIDVVGLKAHDIIAHSASAEVSYNVSAYDLVSRGGGVQSHIGARRDHVDLSLILRGDQWLIANVFNLGGR
jgi:hypothetical protein